MSHSTGGSVTDATSLFRPSILTVSSEVTRPANGLSTGVGDVCHQTSLSPAIEPASVIQGTELPPVPNVEKTVPSGYVFGSNISSRVVNADTAHGASSTLLTVPSDQSSSSSVFTELAKAVSSKPIESNSKTLADSVNKITEDQKHSALNLSEIDPVTGEEDEIPIFRQHCRAYIFDTEKQKWNSLGGSHFHLNDSKLEKLTEQSAFRSRIVVRLASTRRVIINTPIWAEMPVALVNSRNLRIGAVSEDGGHIRSYLFSFSSDELACALFDSLTVRKEKAEKEKLKKMQSPSVVAGSKRPTEASTGGPSPKLANVDPTVPNSRCILSNPVAHQTVPLCQSTSSPVSNQLHDVKPNGATMGTHFQPSVLDNAANVLEAGYTLVVSESVTVPSVTSGVDMQPTSRIETSNSASSSCQLPPPLDGTVPSAPIKPPSELALAHSTNTVVEQFHKLRSDIPANVSLVQNFIDGKDDIVVLELCCHLYSFDEEKREWLRRGDANACIKDISRGSIGHTTCAEEDLCDASIRSCLVVNEAETCNLLMATPLWSGVTACLVDERVLQLITVRSGRKNDTPSTTTPELTAWLLVMQSPEDANKLYQLILERLCPEGVEHPSQLRLGNPSGPSAESITSPESKQLPPPTGVSET